MLTLPPNVDAPDAASAATRVLLLTVSVSLTVSAPPTLTFVLSVTTPLTLNVPVLSTSPRIVIDELISATFVGVALFGLFVARIEETHGDSDTSRLKSLKG